MAKTLTAAAVKNFLPGKVRREIPDGGCPGLHLVIQPSGRKSWALRFRRPDGKHAKLTLGPVDLLGKELAGEPVIGQPLTLAAARRLATEVHRERAMGRDVVDDRVTAKLRQKSAAETLAANTFPAAARDFIEHHAKPKVRRWQEVARLLGLKPNGDELEITPDGLASRWANRAIGEITPRDIHTLVDEARQNGAPGLKRRSEGPTESRARAMFAALSKLFNWLLQRQRVEKNPCAGVHRPDAPEARDRVLTDAELRFFLTACGDLGEPFGPLFKLMLLTGQRLNEVAGMTRSELGADDAGRPIWTLAASRTKNKRPHIVPLSPQACAVIAGVHAIAGKPKYVFSTTGKTHVSGWSKTKRRLDARMAELAGAAVPPWRLHDLRRTCAAGLQRLGVALPVTERILNHVSGSFAGIVGVYQRHEYSSEKREALLAWAAFVHGLEEKHDVAQAALDRQGLEAYSDR
ncbi:MAG: tyrosine-type recombinase/integrase [Beijerinckiaceae bacterium]|jgi:integrase